MSDTTEKDALVERVKAVLDAHQFDPAGPGMDASCHADDCGWTHPWDRPTHEMRDVHRAHVAEQITCVIAGGVGPASYRPEVTMPNAEKDAPDCGCINNAGLPMHNHDGTRWHYQTCPLASVIPPGGDHA